MARQVDLRLPHARGGEARRPEGRDHKFPRLQILTIEALLEGHRPDLPAFAPSATFKQAPRKKSEDKQGKLW